MRRWLREPLLHFLLAGALIFAIYELLNPAANRTDRANQIVLTKDDLRQLAVQWLAQGRPPPTADQMRALVEQRVSEEILFREAVALGLDKDDEIIKRRLAQKMDFLAADVAALQDPERCRTQSLVRAEFGSLCASAARELSPPVLLLRSARRSRQGCREYSTRSPVSRPTHLKSLTVADPFMFQDYYAERAPEQIAKEFGPDFAKAVFQLKPGAWQGPIQSGYGWHLVFVDAIEPGRVPAFEEVEPDVKSAWLDQKQREIKRIAFEAMRARYTVVVPPIELVDFGSLRNPQAPIASTGVLPQ